MKTKEKITKTNTMKLIERMHNTDIYDLLKQDYLENKMTIREMSDKYGISTFTIQSWLKDFDIPRRKLTFV